MLGCLYELTQDGILRLKGPFRPFQVLVVIFCRGQPLGIGEVIIHHPFVPYGANRLGILQ